MTSDVLLLQVLEKYRLTEPVPPDMKKRIMHSRRRMLLRILRETGAYSLLYLLVIWMYLFLRRLGIAATLGTAKAAVIATAVTLSLSVAGGGVYLAGAFPGHDSVPVAKEKTKIDIPDGGKTGFEKRHSSHERIILKYPVTLIPFVNRNAAGAFAGLFNTSMKNAMADYCINLSAYESEQKEIGTDIVITGSLASSGNEILVAYRAVDRRTGGIIYSDTAWMKPGEEPSRRCGIIAGNIAASVKRYVKER